MKKWGEGGGSRRDELHDSSVELIYRRGSSDVVNNKGGATAR